jgi:hypothetical protein
MNKIKEILLRQGKAVSDSRIQEKLNEYELSADSVSDADASTIAQELEAEAKPIAGGLSTATAQGSVTTKSEPKQKRTRKNAKEVTLKDAILHAAKETESELTSMETVIRSQKSAYVESRSASLVNEIRNTSTEIVESVTEKLLGEEGDTESFREIGQIFSEALFPLSANA